MFDPTYSEEQESFIATARKFAADRIIPFAAEWDEQAVMPLETFEAAWHLGLMNVELPEAYGGLGLSRLTGCLVAEELGYGCAGFGTGIMCNHLASLPLEIAGTEAQKERFLGELTESFAFASFCCSEPDAGSDVAGMQTRLIPDGDGFRLQGRKRWITNAHYAKFFAGFATLDPAKRHKGITAFVVPAEAEGISIGNKENKLGQRCSDTADVVFDNVRLERDNILGDLGGGFRVAMESFDKSRPMIAAQCAGIIRRALDESVRYARERQTFGKPIAEHQAIQFMLADMAIAYEQAKLLYSKAAWEVDQGVKRSHTSAIAKAMAADLAMKTTIDAVQIFGGYGYTREYPVEKLMRDAKLMQIYEGTSQVQRMVIARHLLDRA